MRAQSRRVSLYNPHVQVHAPKGPARLADAVDEKLRCHSARFFQGLAHRAQVHETRRFDVVEAHDRERFRNRDRPLPCRLENTNGLEIRHRKYGAWRRRQVQQLPGHAACIVDADLPGTDELRGQWMARRLQGFTVAGQPHAAGLQGVGEGHLLSNVGARQVALVQEALSSETPAQHIVCLDARELLRTTGIMARVVSLPSWELFERQDAAYRATVLPSEVPERVTVEAGSPLGWERYAGPGGAILAMRSFGASAPASDLARHYGFTAEAVAEAARSVLG